MAAYFPTGRQEVVVDGTDASMQSRVASAADGGKCRRGRSKLPAPEGVAIAATITAAIAMDLMAMSCPI